MKNAKKHIGLKSPHHNKKYIFLNQKPYKMGGPPPKLFWGDNKICGQNCLG